MSIKRSVQKFVAKQLNFRFSSGNRFTSTGSLMPHYVNLSNYKDFAVCYNTNPVVKSTIDYKARAHSNVIHEVVRRDNDEVITANDNVFNGEPKAIYMRMNNPNAYQTKEEFLRMQNINEMVFGNSYEYKDVPVGFEVRDNISVKDITGLHNLWSQHTQPVPTNGVPWHSRNIQDLIAAYRVQIGTYREDLHPKLVSHRNSSNISPELGIYTGISDLVSLKIPISNIQMALESRNVIAYNRGAEGIISSGMKMDGMTAPMLPDDKDSIHEELKEYGLLNGQKRFIVSSAPIDYKPMIQNVGNLKLFEEVSSSAILVANKYGVPYNLVKTNLDGTTYANQESDVKRMYQDTIIPEAADKDVSRNNFFGTADKPYYIRSSFAHVAALQEDRKEASETRKINTDTAIAAFMVGAATLEDIKVAAGFQVEASDNRTIFDMDDKQLSIVLEQFNTTDSTNLE